MKRREEEEEERFLGSVCTKLLVLFRSINKGAWNNFSPSTIIQFLGNQSKCLYMWGKSFLPFFPFTPALTRGHQLGGEEGGRALLGESRSQQQGDRKEGERKRGEEEESVCDWKVRRDRSEGKRM